MAEEEKSEPQATMLRVGGKPFRCECGANVFTIVVAYPDRYACNGCGLEYEGER